MIKLSLSYLRKNKKQTLTVLIGIILASILLFSVGILFSSFRECLIKKILKTNDFHVKIKGDLNGISDDNILSLKADGDEYLIKFDNIYDTYRETDKICTQKTCDKIVYNVKLLSLYGIGDNNYLNLFKELLVGLVLVLSIAVFFIIYNSFQISLTKRRRDVALFKAIGISNNQLYKVFLFEGIICGVLGLILGFSLSLFFNISIINLVNNLFDEVFGGGLELSLYRPFIFIPFIFIIFIILFSAILPLFKIKKYKVMELFRENDFVKKESYHFKNFVLNYAYTNYVRSKRKYRSLIICVFIIIILFNSFMRLTGYTLTIINEYIDIPKYDISVTSNMSDYNKLDGLASYLSADKKNIFRSCTKQASIPKENYNQGFQNTVEVLITDVGGNEVINLVNDTIIDKDKMIKERYKPFKSLNSITLDSGEEINNISITNKVPFGFDNMLVKGRVILNLDEDKFSEVCPVFSSNALIKTDEARLDNLILKYVKSKDFEIVYTNVKKAYELINNVVLLIKIFMFLCVGIVVLISVFTIFNIISANIKIRKRELASLKAIGLTNLKINFCLLVESFIISVKGALYAFPFVLLISNGLYENLGMYFEVNISIFNYSLYILSFIGCFLLIFICMFVSHLNLYRNSLILNIKCDNV